MKDFMNIHERYMHEAVKAARRAAEIEEVPVGAVAVIFEDDDFDKGRIIETAFNIREKTGNPLGHAEILLLEKLAKHHGDWRLEDVTIYVTCEPCIMCMGAMLQARVKRVVFGCLDPKAGACGSLYNLSSDTRLNHQIEVVSGILSDECSQLLTSFFKRLR